uniref:Uncharacterized protein n=1 Tax=Rhizophora mucronata TaxID=61149 RepID=A0A2P2QKK3_RHIMU
MSHTKEAYFRLATQVTYLDKNKFQEATIIKCHDKSKS